jgi:hypothetical protein
MLNLFQHLNNYKTLKQVQGDVSITSGDKSFPRF